ncbi:MAG: thioredoxin family protein [Dehalococcoidia bacterium]
MLRPFHRLTPPGLLVLVAVLLLASCGPRAASRVDDRFSGGYPMFRDEASGITAILGTPDLAVGTFRVAVSFSDRNGLIRAPSIEWQLYRTGQSGDAAQVAAAQFFAFPDGARGLYTAPLDFTAAGRWTLTATVPRTDGQPVAVTLPLEVAARASAPVVGAAAPASRNRVAADVPSLGHLTTSPTPEPALYQHRIAESLAAHRPLVVVFASPAFCTTPLCGPQVEEAAELAKTYGDRADFVHVDLYQNPQDIKGDLSGAARSPLLKEWGLRTDQWTFVIDANGTIAARFEAFVPRAELQAALRRALEVPRR